MRRIIVSLLTLGAACAAAMAAAGPPADPVAQWNKLLLQLVRTPGVQPATVHPTRSFAIMHMAMFAGITSVAGVAPEHAAAAAAAHKVLVQLYPGSQALIDSELQSELAEIPDGADKTGGITLGELAADNLLRSRSNDGAGADPRPYVFGMDPGDYQSTPPNFAPQPQFTHWAGVTPFVLDRADQFRPGPPPALSSQAYADAFNEIKLVGVTNSTTATPEQALIGHFWNGAIQNYWNEIAQGVARERHLTITQSARLFALLNVTIADSVIAFYDAKYAYSFWRPVTAIRAAGNDGNPDTAADPEWLPQSGRTAADPSYPGAHAVISAAAAEVLDLFFHEDQIAFNLTSETLPGVERSFPNFSAVREEASLSRILAGQHFRFDEVAGEQLGRAVADFAVEKLVSLRNPAGGYLQQNLVSDLPGLADRFDSSLANPWGIAIGPETPFWIANNHAGVSSIYTTDGSALGAIRIPGAMDGSAGAPTGVVYNNTTNFVATPGQPTRFIFAGEEGTLSAWSTGTNVVLAVDNSSADAIYKGLAIASVGGASYLYAADFHNGRVAVFDGQFQPVSAPGAFADPEIPAGYAPFNVANVGTNLFVSYALQDDEGEDDVPGVGHGFVDVYDTQGHFVRRFASNGPLLKEQQEALAKVLLTPRTDASNLLARG